MATRLGVAEALRAATDAAPEAWAVLEAVRDVGGSVVDVRLLYGNPAYSAMVGLDLKRAVGSPINELFPGVDWTKGVAARLLGAFDTQGRTAEHQVRATQQTGRYAGQDRIFELDFTVVGELIAAGFRDVTADVEAAEALVLERRAAEERLATSLARFEALFEQAPAPMVFIGDDRTTRYNRAAVELFGRDHEELIRLSFTADAPWIPEDQVEVWAEMRRAVRAGESVSGSRFALIRPDGERREVEGAAIPVLGPDGGRRGIVTVLSDMTDHLSLESQLRHAQKMEALGRLAGGIAHDFNNVLMAIMGYAEFVGADARAGRPVTPDHADQVISATRRAMELTARLTTFARRDAARSEPTDVAALVRDVLPLIKGLVPESIDIETHFAAGPAVKLDRSEFEQALVNLVVNAVDAMPNGGRLTVEVEPVDLDADHASVRLGEVAGQYVQVAVSDTGIGMDEATRTRIFEPFYTTKGVGQGTGLGLSMVFAAIERASGRIRVYSEPEHGTTFRIYLPPASPMASEAPKALRPVLESAGGSEVVLLLEDDPLVRGLLATALRGYGYDVSVASRPSEAFGLAAERRFDILLTDMVMPEVTGDVVAARLRETQPRLSVVFMSGYTARAVGLALGPRDSFVHKPIMPGEVGRVVREALDRPHD